MKYKDLIIILLILKFIICESFNSMYLTQDQNHYLQQNIDFIEIHNKFNQYQESQFKYRSITSLIKRK